MPLFYSTCSWITHFTKASPISWRTSRSIRFESLIASLACSLIIYFKVLGFKMKILECWRQYRWYLWYIVWIIVFQRDLFMVPNFFFSKIKSLHNWRVISSKGLVHSFISSFLFNFIFLACLLSSFLTLIEFK